MDEQYKKISVTDLPIFIRISWLTVSFFAIIKLNRKKVKEKVGENHMNDIRHLPGSAEAKAVIRQHRKASFLSLIHI